MNLDNDVILKSFQDLIQECHDDHKEPSRPIESKIEGATSEIPMLLPAVEDESLRPLLMAWYYAGYYSGRHQLMQELKKAK